MRIRRLKNKANLRDVAVDGFDMFLLSLVEDELTLTQLVEMVPRDALECVRHVLHLKRLELLEIGDGANHARPSFADLLAHAASG